jgi:putative FmdB family regulatory protein
MPTYVYECRSCERTFEVEQRMSDAPLTDCGCGAKGTVKRVVQPVGIAFKGSGFYVNDMGANAKTGSTPKREPCSESCACAPPKPETSTD